MSKYEDESFFERNFKFKFAVLNNLVDLLYKLATNFSNFILFFSNVRKAAAYLILSSVALFMIKNAKSFFQYFRNNEPDFDNGLINSLSQQLKPLMWFVVVLLVLIVFVIDFNHAFRISYRFLADSLGFNASWIFSTCLFYSIICSLTSLINNWYRTENVLIKRSLQDWEIMAKIFLSLLKGILESLYGTFILLSPYIGMNFYLFSSLFVMFFALAMVNVIVENLMELNGYRIFEKVDPVVDDNLKIIFSYLSLAVILVLVCSTVAQTPIIYSVLLSCFQNILPNQVISFLAGLVASVFAGQIFIKQQDQFEDAAESFVRFSSWMQSGEKEVSGNVASSTYPVDSIYSTPERFART